MNTVQYCDNRYLSANQKYISTNFLGEKYTLQGYRQLHTLQKYPNCKKQLDSVSFWSDQKHQCTCTWNQNISGCFGCKIHISACCERPFSWLDPHITCWYMLCSIYLWRSALIVWINCKVPPYLLGSTRQDTRQLHQTFIC